MGREGGGEREDGNEYESEVCRCASGLTGWGGGFGRIKYSLPSRKRILYQFSNKTTSTKREVSCRTERLS